MINYQAWRPRVRLWHLINKDNWDHVQLLKLKILETFLNNVMTANTWWRWQEQYWIQCDYTCSKSITNTLLDHVLFLMPLLLNLKVTELLDVRYKKKLVWSILTINNHKWSLMTTDFGKGFFLLNSSSNERLLALVSISIICDVDVKFSCNYALFSGLRILAR